MQTALFVFGTGDPGFSRDIDGTTVSQEKDCNHTSKEYVMFWFLQMVTEIIKQPAQLSHDTNGKVRPVTKTILIKITYCYKQATLQHQDCIDLYVPGQLQTQLGNCTNLYTMMQRKRR